MHVLAYFHFVVNCKELIIGILYIAGLNNPRFFAEKFFFSVTGNKLSWVLWVINQL